MKYFVYYSDDYPDNGGVGFEEFTSRAFALEFILNRMLSKKEDVCLSDYRLICGEKLTLVEKKVITEIGVE